ATVPTDEILVEVPFWRGSGAERIGGPAIEGMRLGASHHLLARERKTDVVGALAEAEDFRLGVGLLTAKIIGRHPDHDETFGFVALPEGLQPLVLGLQALWQRYEAKGLVVVGVPSNDFGGQEPNAEAEILGFCKGAYNVSFPLTSKQVVAGPQAHPFYRWAADTLGA